jgi:pyruvate formate lyase activating enzyme
MQELKPIYDITPETLIDYEGKIASIIWFVGCPLRCIYCQNLHIVGGEGVISEKEALEFLASRNGWVDGVVLSGGECCMYDGLPSFCEKLKNMGLAVKVDTSGIRPKMALELAKNSLIDTIALDFKAQKDMFETITGANAFNLFERTLKGLLSIDFDFSVRTTVYPDYIDESMLSKMANELSLAGYEGVYTIQKAQTHNQTFADLPTSRKEFATSKIESNIPLSFLGF